MKEDEVGGTCGTHWTGERYLQGLGWEARREETLKRPRRWWDNKIKLDLKGDKDQ